MPIDIPEELVTKVYTMGGLRQMALAWNTFDTEFLKRYFKDGGTPYLAYDKELLYSLSKIYRSMPSGHIGSAFNDRFIVPLPSLTVHLHFFNEDGTRDLKKLDSYNEMLDMCLEHGLSIDACDSVGLTMLNSSLAYFSIFSKLLPEEDCGPSSFIGYSEELFDCTVAGILLSRGADPFCVPGKPYLSSNVLMQAAEGTYSTNNRMDTVRETMQANDAQKRFFTDFLGHICKSAPSFSESPYHVFDQRESIKKLIQSGLDKVFYYGAISASENRDLEYAERILSSLNLILEKNVVTEAAMRSDNSKGYYQDSVLCRLCEDLRDNLETTDLWLPLANTAAESNHLETGVYYAAMDYLKRLLTLLRHYGADINLPEESGMLPVSGLLRPTWRRSIKSSSIYKYMKDAEAVLVQCGWDPTVKDDEGKTLFDRYRNKREGQKAFKASMKIVEQIKAEESAYSSIDEEFVRWDMRIEPVHIPEDLATQVNSTEDLTKLVLTWNAFDTESLTEYFEQGGRPYIKFPNRLIRELSQAYAVMTVDFIGQSAQREFIVPLPSLMIRQHFVRNDGTPDMKAIENYSTMLDMCLEHGLNIDACDSVGLTMLGSSMLHFSVFSKLLPDNIDWRNTKVSYSPNLFDYSVAGILLSRGADPLKRAIGQNFTNILSQAADGACKASDCLAHARSSRINPGIWSWTTDNGINLFYADVLSHICENAPYFEKSPFPVREQWNIVTRLITAGFIQLAESDYVIDLDADNSFDTDIDKFKFVPILESLLKRNVLTVEALEPDCGGDSALYSLSKMTGCMLSNAAFATLLPRPAGDPRTQDRYNAIKSHSQHILTTLLRYGADIDHIEYSGRLSVVGLVRVPGNNGSVKRFPKEFYDYLLDFESILLQNGWNHTLKDKYNKTIFDYYPNKQEGLKARRTMDEAARLLESEEAAYAAMDEEFIR